MVKKEVEKKYILNYGFRRYSACKKLGWKKIPCYIKEEDRIENIEVDKIDVLDNTRLNQDTDGFNELMLSIKDVGLLHPIGIGKEDNLKKEDFITLNLAENIHRENITPFELSVACRRLMELGLSISQIAIRLSQPKNRIRDVLQISRTMPRELKESVFVGENKKKRTGSLPFAIVNKISTFRASDKDRKNLVNLAKSKELTLKEIDLVINLYLAGMDLEKAVKKLEEFEICTPRIVVLKKELEKYKGGNNLPTGKILNLMLIGKMPLNKKMIYYGR